ncbi:MAG: DUF3079 domain-containing protein [Rhodoferax sp.]|uniref:DUF3079 domain-containing protein n=1 Tax=Rhodoferax sp. TaxID=50421 RepID=UPI0008D58D8B|nr:DUF3079 domain-containing protein [Rhodoferax sp.]MDP2678914.1 DUF3079 domain-containing protein [Rhodoferax sp.]OGB59830.1 MAG: hypothetical protein A2503_13075 [Burkholderiales bacterium RIFOXYD12_FULL_59_19]OGB81258.1 MAG: hypothetical protein A2496_18295 [Burkholderiales bacterium RIFOXYC12_FULL_60_6]
MAKKFPIHPANPERICWGCDQFCAITAMACANERSPHPSELFGDDWLAWGEQQLAPSSTTTVPCIPADNPTRQAT